MSDYLGHLVARLFTPERMIRPRVREVYEVEEESQLEPPRTRPVVPRRATFSPLPGVKGEHEAQETPLPAPREEGGALRLRSGQAPRRVRGAIHTARSTASAENPSVITEVKSETSHTLSREIAPLHTEIAGDTPRTTVSADNPSGTSGTNVITTEAPRTFAT